MSELPSWRSVCEEKDARSRRYVLSERGICPFTQAHLDGLANQAYEKTYMLVVSLTLYFQKLPAQLRQGWDVVPGKVGSDVRIGV